MEPTSRLLDLQSLDTSIDRLTVRRAALEGEGELATARAEAERAEHQVGELRLALDTFDRDGSKLEHEIDSLTRKAADEESRLFGGAVANAKELGSIQREVDNQLSRLLLDGRIAEGARVTVDVEDGRLVFRREDATPAPEL